MAPPPGPLDRLEVRGERPFSAARFPEQLSNGRAARGVAGLDARRPVHADTSDAQLTPGSRRLVETMPGSPARPGLRVHDSGLLSWVRCGRSDAAELTVYGETVIEFFKPSYRSDL